MKKVLVGTCVLAMTAFGVTNASADPTQSAQARAYGVELSLLGSELVDQTPEVSSVFPPGSSEQEDILTVDAEDLILEGAAIQQAETSGETDIIPSLVPDGEGDDGGGAGIFQSEQLGGDGGGGILDGILGGDDGGLLGGIGLGDLLGGSDEDDDDDGDNDGDGSIGGIGGPDDDDIDLPAANARAFSSISLTGLAIDEDGDGEPDEGGDGGGLFDGLLGGITGGESDESGDSPLPEIPIIGNSAGEAGQVEIQQTEILDDILDLDGILGGAVGGELQEIIFDALLRLGVVESEAVASCVNGAVRVDVASRLFDDQGSDLEIGSILDDLVSELLNITDDLLPELIRTIEGETTVTDQGVSINALHIIVGEDLGLDLLGSVTGDEGDEGDEPLLDIVLGHSEVSNNVCAQQTGGDVDPLPPAGDERTLPVTGGGLGALPGFLALGLAGGAVAAGRVALRSRREHTL